MSDARVDTISVPEGEAPSAAVIAARIDLGAAEYHEHCCPWLMWSHDASLFTEMPDCDCGGPAMAAVYVEQVERVEQLEASERRLRDICQRIRAGWLPHRLEPDGTWWWGRPSSDDGWRLWTDGLVPTMAVVEHMTDEEVEAWTATLHPFAPEAPQSASSGSPTRANPT